MSKRVNKCMSCNARLKAAQSFVLTFCNHIFCRTCLTSLCVNALALPPSNVGFMNALCSECSQAVPLQLVKQVLSPKAFVKYEMLWNDTRRDCVSCANVDSIQALRKASCGHYYCKECVRRMSRLALADRALVPIRCCRKELPMEYVREALPGARDYDLYQRLLREKDWKNSDLLTDQEYAKLVVSLGAKQCPGCGIGVDRDFGCIHMKCPNGHEFCFTCLRFWKKCHCQLIPEAELAAILND